MPINVYLKFKSPNQASLLIHNFNQLITEYGLFNQYKISPFIEKYPLHVTLYLTHYQEEQIPRIINKIHRIAKHQKPLSLSTNHFIAKNSGYVMLTVKNNPNLNQLNRLVLNSLVNLRDKKALIPGWAAQDPVRQQLFHRYGSPNVFTYFNPHFSLFDPKSLSMKQRKSLYKTLQRLITHFSQTHPMQTNITAYAIGIGIVDEQGQIIKELKTFTLK